MNDIDREEIARLIKTGVNSGIIYDGEGKRIAWKLVINVNEWTDDDRMGANE